MTDTKILFLDVDGVLNNHGTFEAQIESMLCSKTIARLDLVLDATGAKVVLSSAWRNVPRLEEFLRAAGVFRCAHPDMRTPHHGRGQSTRSYIGRGAEIADWLSYHPDVERFAIVDDDDDMLPWQKPYFVKTSFDTGMTDDHAVRLTELLGGYNANHPSSYLNSQPTDVRRAIAAVCHDLVEDTTTTLGDLYRVFGARVAALVDCLTDVSRPADGNRAQRKQLDLQHIAKAPPAAKTIKLADLIDNTLTIKERDPDFWRVYRREKMDLLEVLKDGDAELWQRAASQCG